jgi:magnesium-transporting ATPase (P-type)
VGTNSIVEIADGETLIRALADGSPDLVLLDWRLYGSPAPETCRRLRKAYPHLKIVLLSMDANDAASSQAKSVVCLTTKDKIIAAISITDVIRPESKRVIDELNEMGIEVAMLTGDSQAVARAVADQLGIQRVFAEAPAQVRRAYPCL